MKKVFYTLFLIFCISILQTQAQNSLDSGLVAYYPFTGNDSDASVSNNHPAINTATLTTDRFGNTNSAYRFDGNGSYMLVHNNSTINFNNKMSICVWMKPSGYYQGLCFNNVLISKAVTDGSWGNQGNYSLRFADYVNGCNSLRDTTKEYLYGPDGGVCLNKNIQTNRWYFIVFTTDGTTCKTYINNKLSHTGAHPAGLTFTNQHDLRIGMFGDTLNYPYYFKGVLDDIRIYNRGLDPDEVGLLYNDSPYPTINGNVYVDVNNNGVMDSTDYYKPNVKINAGNGSFAITNLQGNYDIAADTLGAFSDSIIVPTFYSSNPTLHNYNFTSYDTTVAEDYVLQNTAQPFDSLSLRIIPLFNAARPGFDYPVGVTYTNDGNTFLNNAILQIPYDSSKLQYVNCTNTNLTNNGISLNIAATNLAPGEHHSFMIGFKVKTYAPLGDTIKLIATVTTNSIAAIDSSVVRIRGSYDPNEKDATPILSTTEVAQGKYIDYIVRFENTGTDTAFKIIVTDEMSNYLDLNSIQLTAVSHSCTVQVNESKVSFIFNNIKLPYTTIDKTKSHGYIAFRVKPKPTVTDGIDIPNTAFIYFDYNLPIITNTAITKIKNNVLPVKIKSYELSVVNEKQVANTWATSSEINTSHFNIQRSTNGSNFETIGQVKAVGAGNYTFIDPLANYQLPLTLYYRLQIVDKNGTIHYSDIKTLNFKPKTLNNFSLYPNPASNEIKITKNAIGSIYEKVFITDITGKIISKITLHSFEQTVNINAFDKGVYILVFENGEKLKLIKQ